jgi:histidine kinase
MERLVADLWDATLEGRDEPSYVFEDFDWREAAAGIVEVFSAAPGADVHFDAGRDVPAVTADRIRAVQVLSNLLDNAVKYSSRTARVDITIRREGDAVVTTVADSGPGIPEQEREHVFERFARLDTPGSHPAGIGLGLHLARRLVEGMGGRICVEPSPHGGAAFSFTLPVARANVIVLRQ